VILIKRAGPDVAAAICFDFDSRLVQLPIQTASVAILAISLDHSLIRSGIAHFAVTPLDGKLTHY
jgi:hypothetical protein